MSKNKKWLIKSSDTILGPLEFDHIVENLFKGDIHILDEIKGPFDRWCSIKDNPLFTAALEKLKSSTYDRREQTVTATVDINTSTRELTATRELTHKPPKVYKPKTTQTKPNESDSKFVLKTPPREQKKEPLHPGPKPPITTQSPKSFLIIFSTTLAIVITLFFYRSMELKKIKKIEETNAHYNKLSDKALQAIKTGNYQIALKNFNMAYKLSPEDRNLFIEMAPLSVQFEGKSSQVETQLEKFMMDSKDKSFLNYSRNVIGLTHSYRNRHHEALLFYNQITQMDNGFLPAIINKTFSLLKLDRPKEAVEFMEKEIKNFPKEAIVHYLYIRSLMEMGLKEEKEAIIKKAFQLGRQFSEKFLEFKQEVLFLMTLGKMNLDKNEKKWMKSTTDFLKVDIELTNLHKQDPHIDFQSFNWLDYKSHCEKMQENIEDLYLSQLLKGFCLLKINRLVEGKKVFEKLLAKHSQKGILQALYASALFKIGDTTQAKNILNFIDQMDQKQIVVEVTLRGCLLSGDLFCAKKIMNNDDFTKYLSMLYSHWGYSAIFSNEDPEQTQVSVNLGLEISPNFAPLLRLKKKMK